MTSKLCIFFWIEDESKNRYLQMFNQETATMLDNQKLSEGIRVSLKQLNAKEIDYVLIASKVPHQYRGTNKITFLKSIPWFFVFDLFDPKSKVDGLHYVLNETNDSDRARLTYLEDYDENVKRDHSTLDCRATTWILRGEKQHDSDWTRHSKHNIYQAFLTCQKQSLAGHIHCVFLCMSDEFLVEMADVIDLLFTIMGKEANKCISIISDKKEIGERMIKPLKDSIRNDLNYPCTILGVPLDLLKIIIREMLGPNNFYEPNATTDLPHISGLTSVLNKRINSLTDLEVYCPKPILTTSITELKKARDNFYKGGDIKQINLFHRHDIQRTLQDELTRETDSYLKKLSNPNDQDYTGFVETVTLSYEPGSGATTLGRRILWEKRKNYRCAVLKTIGLNTASQIDELQMFSYETGLPFIPPVLILADNFPDHEVHRLINKLLERKTKCVLLITIPIANVTKDSKDESAHLGELDEIEIQRVDNILVDIEDKNDEQKKAAAEILKRERRFIWLGLELFGRLYDEIEERLTNHIQQTLSSHLKEKLKDAYEMILHFCCLFDYYSKGRSIFPHSCILDILDKREGLDKNPPNQIVHIHSKFAGLLLEDRSVSGGYQGWRPAHFLVGEIVRREMDLVATVKNLCAEIKDNVRSKTRAKEVLIKDAVTTCLKRDSENIEDIEDDDLGLFEKQKYSTLLLDVMPTKSESEVTNALELLVNLNEIAEETVDQNAYCSQQLARVLAYEVGTKTISAKDASLLSKLPLTSTNPVTNDFPTSGLEAAHQVIDRAVNLQPTYGHHLVTKGTFCKTELNFQLLELTGNRHDFASEDKNLQNFVKKAINITKKGISLYDSALTKTSYDSYLSAMFGKIEIMITLLEIFKNLPCFFEHEQGPDEMFKMYMTFGTYPDELELILGEDLNYFLKLRSIPSQLFDEFFKEMKMRRKESLNKHEIQVKTSAKIKVSLLRKRFYNVTKLDRTILARDSSVLKEDIVEDILFHYDETPYSAWKKLPPMEINQIYKYLKQAIPNETGSDKAMLIYARAALQQSNIDDLSQHVKTWWKKWPNSPWANLFNCMVHFPIPNGSLKSNVSAVNQSISICKSKIMFSQYEYRKSSAQYFLGKGIGTNAILPSQEFEDTNRELEMKGANSWSRRNVRETDFWRSKDVYEKLERLCGQKKKRGVLNYRGIEIVFDNERYTKESRDDLWFCLGFTFNGPYAYDPVNQEMFNSIKQGFSTETKVYSDVLNFHAPTTTTQTLKSSSNVMTSLPQKSRNELASNKKNNDEWKTNEKLIIRKRAPGGHQITFNPLAIDSKGRVIHGAHVKGARKSLKCTRPSTKCSSGKCTFAHPEKNDPVRQTVCYLCTKNKADFCEKRKEHEEYIFDLGPFKYTTGETWMSTKKM